VLQLSVALLGKLQLGVVEVVDYDAAWSGVRASANGTATFQRCESRASVGCLRLGNVTDEDLPSVRPL
jgi:hypothetical protein